MGRKKKTPDVINIEEFEIENKVDIDYDKLALAIVNAKRIEKENDEAAKAKALAEWRASVGYKEHNDKKGLLKHLFRFGNSAKVVFNIMFISKKKYIAISPTSAFIQGMTTAFFRVIQFVLTLLAISFWAVLFYHPGVDYDIGKYLLVIAFGIFSFMLSRIFRLMAIEIDQMSNREQILGVFTAVISVFPLVEKIIELFKGVG